MTAWQGATEAYMLFPLFARGSVWDAVYGAVKAVESGASRVRWPFTEVAVFSLF